jgi:parallel beta-helix repeat protein
MRRLVKSGISVLAACGLSILFASGPSAALADVTLTVRCTGSDYTTITAALAAAPLDRAMIKVCGGAGNYTETVTIVGYSNLKVIGMNDPILNPPFSGFGGSIISVTTSTNVTLKGLVIDGNGDFAAAAVPIGGIEWYDSSGTISDNTIRRIRHTTLGTDWNGIGILIDNSGTSTVLPVTVKNNTIYDYQFLGVKATGKAKMTVSNNFIRGWGIAPNKPAAIWLLEVSDGASVVNNRIIGDWGPENLVASSGILIDKTSRAKVMKNSVSNVWFGIYIHDGLAGLPDGSFNTVTSNTLTDVYDGIQLYAENASSTVNNNKIAGNKIYNYVSGGGLSNYAIYLDNNGGSMNATAITANKIYGDWINPIFRLGDTGTTGVVPQTNTIKLIVPPGS